MLFAFSGIDGAGKSTQIELLKNKLEAEGQKVKLVWARGGYTPILQGMKDLIRKMSPKSLPKPGKSKERTKTFNNPKIRKVWLVCAILDLWFLYAIRCRVLSFIGYYIIFDRYVEDTLIDFQLNFAEEQVDNWLLWKFLVKNVPKPDKHFILLIPVAESQYRSKLKNEPFPDSKQVLYNRLETYQQLVKKGNYYEEIDCLLTIEEISKKIISSLKKSSLIN